MRGCETQRLPLAGQLRFCGEVSNYVLDHNLIYKLVRLKCLSWVM